MIRILICGLPGSGKTTLAKYIHEKFDLAWFNADKVREQFNDWDFSKEGRERQANRMKELSLNCSKSSVSDFVCPTQETRDHFNPDITIWMNTIKEGRFADTNSIFQPPTNPDYIVTDWSQPEDVINYISTILKGNSNE